MASVGEGQVGQNGTFVVEAERMTSIDGTFVVEAERMTSIDPRGTARMHPRGTAPLQADRHTSTRITHLQ